MLMARRYLRHDMPLCYYYYGGVVKREMRNTVAGVMALMLLWRGVAIALFYMIATIRVAASNTKRHVVTRHGTPLFVFDTR